MAEWICKRTKDGTIKPMYELIRCKDCIYSGCDVGVSKIECRITGRIHGRLWFCADAEHNTNNVMGKPNQPYLNANDD